MINESSIRAVAASRLDARFGKPLYDTYGFSQIPPSIVHLLTGNGDPGLPDDVWDDLPRRYDKVILVFIDAFGWQFFERYREKFPFLARITREGVASKLTTQFPSTTAAHTTSIHTGLAVGESGIFEWYYYEPLVDCIIAPLLFSFSGDRERNTLAAAGIDPRAFYPAHTLYQTLAAHGVRSYVFQHRDYAISPFSDAVTAGAQPAPYQTVSEALLNLADAVAHETEKAYFFLYISNIDQIAHTYGPESRQLDAEAGTLLTQLERLLHPNLAGQQGKTLLLVTADHGQTAVSPETTIYLNRLSPSIEPFIKTNRQGERLVPAGSARDMFLYIEDEHLDEVHALLSRQLEGRAGVFRVQDLIERRFFGPLPPSDTFLSRVGNLVILPYAHETVWWYQRGRFEQRFQGHHGGLSPDEMETILLALPY